MKCNYASQNPFYRAGPRCLVNFEGIVHKTATSKITTNPNSSTIHAQAQCAPYDLESDLWSTSCMRPCLSEACRCKYLTV